MKVLLLILFLPFLCLADEDREALIEATYEYKVAELHVRLLQKIETVNDAELLLARMHLKDKELKWYEAEAKVRGEDVSDYKKQRHLIWANYYRDRFNRLTKIGASTSERVREYLKYEKHLQLAQLY